MPNKVTNQTKATKQRRRAKGEGSIYQRKDGRWVGKIPVMTVNGKSTTRCVYGKTQRETLDKFNKMKRELSVNSRALDTNKQTVEQFFKEWSSDLAINYLRPTTLELYARVFKNHILPSIGNIPIQKLNTFDVQRMVNQVYRRTSSSRQAHVAKNGVASMLNSAHRLGLIINNPVRGVITPKYEVKEKELWNKDELKRFLATAETSPYYLIYQILGRYGLRRGEALGLRARDIDLDNKCLHIRQQIVPLNNHATIAELKTKASVRDLPLDDELFELLKEAKAKVKEEDDLLFTTKNGTPIAPRNLYRDFCRVTDLANLKHIPMHSLRHMVACFMRDAGVDPKTVQVFLGHSTLEMTLRIYQHSNMDNKENAVNSLLSLLAA